MFGIKIDGKHTFDDYGLRMTSLSVPLPKPKIKTVDIPYTHGSIDLTDVTGETYFSDRENVSFTFKQYDGDFTKWQRAVSELAAALHGKKVKVILDNDPLYYYVMRLEIKTEKSKKVLSDITLTGTAEPFKYLVYDNGNDWLWDTFSFIDGVIKKSRVEVDGVETITLAATDFYTVPEFNVISENNLSVIWNEVEYPLKTGKNYFPQIKVKKPKNTLQIIGKGTVDIDFKGRYL